MDRERLKAMRVKNPRTNGERMLNAEINDALNRPWWYLIWLMLAVVGAASLVAIAVK
jgi:hypothetical protein